MSAEARPVTRQNQRSFAMDAFDHRSIGRRQDLFHLQEEGPGAAFWHPRGFAVYRALEAFIRRRMRRAGYGEVRTPQLLDSALWQRSGHLEKFGDAMFQVPDGNRLLALKPMSCPGHVQVFNHLKRSYRDLPLRYAEFGACHRNEPSGALVGLKRARAFVQDDAHVFCLPAQARDEIVCVCQLLKEIYAALGFADFAVALALRPAVRAGDDAAWDRAEAQLLAAAREAGFEPALKSGEGAFYGPKLEFILEDCAGRSWQCGTVQLDFVLPERLDARYVDADGREKRPVMIHHAVFGSMERFIAVLLEHHAGNLPFLLAPDQLVVASVGEGQADYAQTAWQTFFDLDLRVVLDDRRETLSRKIAEARAAGTPVVAIVGAPEAAEGAVTLRRRNAAQERLLLAEAARRLAAETRA
jgi:threonyl-tRNA synthetase